MWQLKLSKKQSTKRKIIQKSLLLAAFILPSFCGIAQKYNLVSPDGSIKVNIAIDKTIQYQVLVDGREIIKPSAIAMSFENHSDYGANGRVINSRTTTVNETLTPVLKVRTAKISNHYNQLKLDFKQGYSLSFRAFDQGIAYRFSSKLLGQAKLTEEQANFNFVDGTFSYFPFEKNFKTATQPKFTLTTVKGIDSAALGSLPALFVVNGINVLLTETDLQSFPGLWLKGKGDGGIYGVHPADLDVNEKDLTHLAIVDRNRTFPWRIIGVARSDAQLLNNQMSYALAQPSKIKDNTWIKPGKIAWDWYNENNLKGVDFIAGINTATYKYYADFAADFAIENILIDDGWSSQEDVLTVLPNIDMAEIIHHANSKGVNVQLWVPWKALDKNLEAAMKLYSDWGITGVKIDFMNSDSQKRVDFYWRAAAMAAKYKIMVNFHGSYKPAGIHRTYPNVMTREGVRGLENNKWSEVTASHNLHLPFIRMIAGPMDYTPGAMRNSHKKSFNKVWSKPMSLTTRAHQVAMYVLYESPLQMLADTPTSYRADPEIPKFIAAIPTVWDDFQVLHANIGHYLSIARRSGEDWFVGAMTNEQKRQLTLNLDFLDDGDYQLTILQDGINAENHAEDYKIITQKVKKGDSLDINMASSGGWIAKITPIKQQLIALNNKR